jgi:hypothetical protein
LRSGAGNGHRVLERLYEGPIVSVNEVRELTGTAGIGFRLVPA